MEIIFEILFYLFAELLLGFLGEALVELGLHSLAKKLAGGTLNRFVTWFLYAALGLALGAFSLKFIPLMVFSNRFIPILYFVVAPIVGGLGLCLVSWVIEHGHGDSRFFRIDKFVCGVIFVLAFSVTRSIFG